MQQHTHTIWVCMDCYFAHHYGAYCVEGKWYAGESHEPCEHEPLGRWHHAADLSDYTCSDHNGTDDKDCSYCGESTFENGLEEFSMSSCHGCGSNLGGSRYRLAVWMDK